MILLRICCRNIGAFLNPGQRIMNWLLCFVMHSCLLILEFHILHLRTNNYVCLADMVSPSGGGIPFNSVMGLGAPNSPSQNSDPQVNPLKSLRPGCDLQGIN